MQMASSCIRIPRDHIQRERDNNGIHVALSRCPSQAQAAFRKNLKDLVRDHLHTCIVLSACSDSNASDFGNSTVSNCEDSQRRRSREVWENEEQRGNTIDRNLSAIRGESRNQSLAATRRQQSRILDRWAARQAREMITTIERQAHEAEIQALSSTQPVSAMNSSFLRETSPARSESSVEVPNLRASSLVQMWRELEAETRLSTGNQASSVNSAVSSRSNTMSTVDTVSSIEETLRSETGDSSDDRDDTVMAQDESYTDSESVLTPRSEVQSDICESERGRVADMIRRLTSGCPSQSTVTCWSDDNAREQPTAPGRESSPGIQFQFDHVESIRFPLERNPHRRIIRGHQATRNFLAQIERERQRELVRLVDCHAVSRFSHRSRIQSLLRFKVLQREAIAQDQRRPTSTTAELDQLQRGTSILHLRERFSSRGQDNRRAATISDDSSSTDMHLLDNSASEHSTSEEQQTNANHMYQEVATTNQENNSQSQLFSREELEGETSQISDTMMQERNLLVNSPDWQEASDTDVSTRHWEGDVVMEEPEPNIQLDEGDTEGSWSNAVSHQEGEWNGHRQATSANEEQEDEVGQISDTAWQERSLLVNSLDWQEVANASESSHHWEEGNVMNDAEPNTQSEQGDSEGTWLSVVPYQQTEWSGNRHAAYGDWLENNSGNLELQHLVERGVVTSILSSNFRERMDRLILSYLERQALQYTDEEEEEDHFFEQQNHQVSNAIQVAASTSSQLPLPSRWLYHQDSRQPSSFMHNLPHHSLEMDLIYGLKGDMQRLHQEMCDLRRSIESCMNMQLELQHSIKQEVAAAISHSGGSGESLHHFNWVPTRKGSCCICYEQQVDSLLYRCGHMCTCFKCADELQWRSGKCPICRAPIVDVVRAYADS